jgi:hypothetical protein
MEKKQEAIEKVQPAGALAPVDLVQHQGQGLEGIGQGDVRFPQLVLAQSGHPQVKKTSDRYVPGLAEGDLFNDLTNETYTQPLDFVVVKFLGKRAVEFYGEGERTAGQVVKDFDVPLDDPRCQFTTDEKGNRVKPRATVFADYLVLLPATFEVLTLSLKGAALGRNGAATQLNSVMSYPLRIEGEMLAKPPAWARQFRLTSAGKSDGKYNWSVPKVQVSGITEAPVRAFAAQVYDQYKAATVVIERTTEAPAETGADEDVPF